MLTVLGGLAEFERHLILSRTAEGRTRAQASGVKFGRKPSLTPYQRAESPPLAGDLLEDRLLLVVQAFLSKPVAKVGILPAFVGRRHGLAFLFAQ
jgi:DNA invertase Pin-like site-specific DNA recombinase